MHTLNEIKLTILYDSTVGTTAAESFATQTLNAIGNNTGLTVEENKVFFNESKTIGMTLYANGSNFYYTSFFNYNGSKYLICKENYTSVNTSTVITLQIHRSTNEKVTVIGIGTDAYPHYTIYAENNSGVGSIIRYSGSSGYSAYSNYGTDSLSSSTTFYSAYLPSYCLKYSCTKMPDVYNNNVFSELYWVTSVFSDSSTYYAASDQLVQFEDSIYRFVPIYNSSSNALRLGGFAFPVSDPT